MKKMVMVLMVVVGMVSGRTHTRVDEFDGSVSIESKSGIFQSKSSNTSGILFVPYIASSSAYRLHGLSVKFVDGTVLEFPNVTSQVSVFYSTFNHYVSVRVTGELKEKLLTTEIEVFRIGDRTCRVPRYLRRQFLDEANEVYNMWNSYQ